MTIRTINDFKDMISKRPAKRQKTNDGKTEVALASKQLPEDSESSVRPPGESRGGSTLPRVVTLDLEIKHPKILLVGEGDFSYATALARHFGRKADITATSLDTLEILTKAYETFTMNKETLVEQGVHLHHGIDATRLEEYFGETHESVKPLFSRIVFMFPQYQPKGRESRNPIKKQRALLTEFMKSAREFLAPHGQIWITLRQGQGGTKLDVVQRLWKNSWQITDCAAKAKLICIEAFQTNLNGLYKLGYQDRGRLLDLLITIDGKYSNFLRNNREEQVKAMTHIIVSPDGTTRAIGQESHSGDIAFKRPEGFDEETYLIQCKELFIEYGIPESTISFKHEWTHPEGEYISRNYHVELRNSVSSVSMEDFRRILLNLRQPGFVERSRSRP